ncbi:MAG: nitroreductase family protein [Clostridia bacterium]|nr:nitroreductase family protein [Clostridia bacterium]
MLHELIVKNRSYRRFDGAVKITDTELYDMVDAARCSASAANRQRVRFVLVNTKGECDKIFPTLKLAAYLTDWAGPGENERPTAYIALMCKEEKLDTPLAIDIGIAAQSILLRATEMGFGGCMIWSFDKDTVTSLLNKDGYIPTLIIALGKPTERAYLTDVKDGNIKYFRDENDDHAVPKLSLDELII